MPRSVIAVGPDAIRKAVEILAAGGMGEARSAALASGAQWGGDRMLLRVDSESVRFVAGSTLYKQDQDSFLLAEFPAGSLPPRPAPWLQGVPVLEMPLFLGLAGELTPFWSGTGSACAFLEQFGAFYRNHRTEIQLAERELRFVAEGLLALQRWPALFEPVMEAMGPAARTSLPRGLAAPDLGAFLGRLLMGARAGRITLERVPESLRALPQPLPPLAHHRRMLDKLERSAERVAPWISRLLAAL